MLTILNQVLQPNELAALRQTLSGLEYVDGRASAGDHAGQVKRNEELKLDDAKVIEPLARAFMSAYGRNDTFRSAALPLHVALPVFARYTEGMHYGSHIDEAIMGMSGKRFRTDIATTLFISSPSDYEGGELVVETSAGEQHFKLAAGDAVLYPASSLHRVETVTSGERLVAVSWIQSMVRDAGKRQILHDLNDVRESLMAHAPNEPRTHKSDRAYSNLLRMWAEVS